MVTLKIHLFASRVNVDGLSGCCLREIGWDEVKGKVRDDRYRQGEPSPQSGTTLREYHFDPTLNERWTALGKSTQTEFN